MTAHPSNAFSAIAACLMSASVVTELPITTLDSGHIAASILPDVLPHLPSRPDSICRPFGAQRDKDSQSRIVLCIPPDQMALSPDDESSCHALCDTLHIRPPHLTYWLYAAIALYNAGPRGKAMVLMPQTSLSRSAWRMGQKDLVDRKLIEAIVALPDTITAVADEPHQPPQHRPHTVTYDTLVILSHPENRAAASQITFVLPGEIDQFANGQYDLRSTDMSISYDDIVENGYLLTPFRYRKNQPRFSNGIRLGDVATVTRGVSKARLRALRQLTTSSPDGLEPAPDGSAPVAYLTSKDFEHGYDYCHLAQTGMHLSPSYFTAHDLECAGVARFTDDSIVLSRTGTPFKSCHLGCASFAHQVEAYLIADNLYRIQPTSDLDADYLLAFFSSASGQQTLSTTANSATTMQQISPNDLRDMLIPLPPIERQRDIAARYRKQLDRIADMERQRAVLAAERNQWFPHAM